jgi:hypothetical protein
MDFFIGISAAKKADRRGYLARLHLGADGDFLRDFVAPTKLKKGASYRHWSLILHPGEAAECRHSHWDGQRFAGGTKWLINDGGQVRMVGRDEAYAFLAHPRLGDAPAPLAEQMLPFSIEIYPEEVEL